MNIRFLRGQYSQPNRETVLGNQYIWDGVFTEGNIVVQFFEYQPGVVPKSAEERKDFAVGHIKLAFSESKAEITAEKDVNVDTALGKQFDVVLSRQKVKVRTFADGNIYYILMAIPQNSDAEASVEDLFNSFKFVKQQ